MISEEQQLVEFLIHAQISCEKGTSVEDFEPAFTQLLEFIKKHPGCAVRAEQLFLDGVRSRTLCWELLAFCMHSLRMSSVKDELASIVSSGNHREMSPLSHVLEAFEDDWEDADMYSYYRSMEDSARE